jgi:hypothetical protein
MQDGYSSGTQIVRANTLVETRDVNLKASRIERPRYLGQLPLGAAGSQFADHQHDRNGFGHFLYGIG